jgi:hypothetical protein
MHAFASWIAVLMLAGLRATYASEYGGTGRGAACGDFGHCPLRMYAPANELIRLNPV